MTATPVGSAVARAVVAVRERDRQGIVDSFRELRDFEPAELLTRLFATVDALADSDPSTLVPATRLLPDPAVSGQLLEAVLRGDRDTLGDWFGGAYPDLVAALVCLAAALASSQRD